MWLSVAVTEIFDNDACSVTPFFPAVFLSTGFSGVRSQASNGPQAKQDGLREEVEEAWRRLENIKVPAVIHPWCCVVERCGRVTSDLSAFLSP